MELLPEPNSTLWPFPFTEQDWEQTPPAVRASLHTLHDGLGQLQSRVEGLEARLNQHSTTSSKPPSSDSPDKKPRRRTGSKHARKGGGKPGHAGHRQMLLAPDAVTAIDLADDEIAVTRLPKLVAFRLHTG
jgi:transposase